jgi:hypothetical protein
MTVVIRAWTADNTSLSMPFDPQVFHQRVYLIVKELSPYPKGRQWTRKVQVARLFSFGLQRISGARTRVVKVVVTYAMTSMMTIDGEESAHHCSPAS